MTRPLFFCYENDNLNLWKGETWNRKKLNKHLRMSFYIPANDGK